MGALGVQGGPVRAKRSFCKTCSVKLWWVQPRKLFKAFSVKSRGPKQVGGKTFYVNPSWVQSSFCKTFPVKPWCWSGTYAPCHRIMSPGACRAFMLSRHRVMGPGAFYVSRHTAFRSVLYSSSPPCPPEPHPQCSETSKTPRDSRKSPCELHGEAEGA